ncbi:MAG: hypothetical protein REJ50_25110, partial [Bordetella sp.]|nr:hypothetical protein [Bordetella sp.]
LLGFEQAMTPVAPATPPVPPRTLSQQLLPAVHGLLSRPLSSYYLLIASSGLLLLIGTGLLLLAVMCGWRAAQALWTRVARASEEPP